MCYLLPVVIEFTSLLNFYVLCQRRYVIRALPFSSFSLHSVTSSMEVSISKQKKILQTNLLIKSQLSGFITVLMKFRNFSYYTQGIFIKLFKYFHKITLIIFHKIVLIIIDRANLNLAYPSAVIIFF